MYLVFLKLKGFFILLNTIPVFYIVNDNKKDHSKFATWVLQKSYATSPQYIYSAPKYIAKHPLHSIMVARGLSGGFLL